MIMKKFFYILLAVCLSFSFANAQEFTIATAHVQSDYKLPKEVDTNVRAKLKRLLSKNGLSANSAYARFAIVPQIAVIDEQISGGVRATTTIDFTLDLQIVDLAADKLFSSYSIELKGKGLNRANAIAKGIKSLNVNNKETLRFVADSRVKMEDYYERQSVRLIQQAKAAIAASRYELAIQTLLPIPSSIPSYPKVQSVMMEAIVAYNEAKARKILDNARTAWAASQDLDGAERVVEILSEMPANTKYQKDKDRLIASIGKRVKQLDQRAWNASQRRLELAHKERLQEMKAVRDAAVAIAKNAPRTVVKHNYILW